MISRFINQPVTQPILLPGRIDDESFTSRDQSIAEQQKIHEVSVYFCGLKCIFIPATNDFENEWELITKTNNRVIGAKGEGDFPAIGGLSF